VPTAAEVFPAAKTLKAGKAAGCDEIRPEMLKALNRRVIWLSHARQVAWCSVRPKDWHTGVIISIRMKGDRKECTSYRGYRGISTEPPWKSVYQVP